MLLGGKMVCVVLVVGVLGGAVLLLSSLRVTVWFIDGAYSLRFGLGLGRNMGWMFVCSSSSVDDWG